MSKPPPNPEATLARDDSAPRAGLSLPDAIAELLLRCFGDGKSPARKWLVLMIQKEYPHLDSPRLDLIVGTALNRLVDEGTLQRINAKFYAPGAKYYS